MAANNTLAVSELDFDGQVASLIAFTQAYPNLKDAIFPGSNFRTLIDVISRNSYLMAFLANMSINEMFLDSGVIRDTVVSRAKDLNYVPRSARSSEAKVDFTVFPNDNPAFVTVPAGYQVQGSNGNSVFNFLTAQALVISPSNGVYTSANVSVFEGVNVVETFVVNTATDDQRFILSNPNIDTTSLNVLVTNASGASVGWSYASSLLGLKTDSEVWFLQATADNYEILFGQNVVGAYPPNGGVITAKYRVCNQDAPNGISAYKAAGSTLGGYSSFSVVPSTDSDGNAITSSGGAGPESIASIKFNAPRNYQTLERAVTGQDYKNILFAQYPEIRAINVYGGEELSPPQYGKVYIAVDVLNAVGLSDNEKTKIQTFLTNKAMLTVHPVVVAPEYTFAEVVTEITYNLNVTNYSSSDIQSLVLSQILAYNSSNLIDFAKTFRYSKLVAAIDAGEASITSSETHVRIFKTIEAPISGAFTGTLNFQNGLNVHNLISTNFLYGGVNAFLMDDGIGGMVVATLVNNVASVLNNDIGTVDYTTGVVALNNLSFTLTTGTQIKLYAETQEFDFSTNQNTILEISTADITVNVTAIRA